MKKFFVLSAFLLFASCGEVDFTGNYHFFISQEIVVANPYVKKVNNFGFFSTPDNKAKIMALTKIKIKLVKESQSYKGQLTYVSLQNQGMMGMVDDTTELDFAMTNIMITKDTLNFMLSSDLPLFGNRSLKGFIVKDNPNILGISEDVIDRPNCFEINPCFAGNHEHMILFKETKLNANELTSQMTTKYRDCLLEKAKAEENKSTKEWIERTIGYIDSVMLRKPEDK
jgi:hypothetical protein